MFDAQSLDRVGAIEPPLRENSVARDSPLNQVDSANVVEDPNQLIFPVGRQSWETWGDCSNFRIDARTAALLVAVAKRDGSVAEAGALFQLQRWRET
jgi:hypothetical protein